jgi:hypothetical protein
MALIFNPIMPVSMFKLQILLSIEDREDVVSLLRDDARRGRSTLRRDQNNEPDHVTKAVNKSFPQQFGDLINGRKPPAN